MSSYDLHVHTHWSYDARADIAEVFAAANRVGLRVLAITEHHVIDSVPEATALAAQYPGLRYLPSAELTVHTSIGAVDLVCLGFPSDAAQRLSGVWERYHNWMQEYGEAVSAGMQALGFDYSPQRRAELLRTYRPEKAMAVQGVTHLNNAVQRRYFAERGFIQSEEEYGALMARVAEVSNLPRYPAVSEVVSTVRAAGVLVSIAHPRGYFLEADRDRMDTLRQECLLDGIECAHPAVPLELRGVYREYCETHELFSTGGSDCHFTENVDAQLGSHGGPEEWWDEIEARLAPGVMVNG